MTASPAKCLANMTVNREQALMQQHQVACERAAGISAKSGGLGSTGRLSNLESTGVFAASPMSPAKKELYRAELEAQGKRMAGISTARQSLHAERTMTATQRSPGPLDHTRGLTDTKVQDWNCIDGTRPHIHSICPDYSRHVNVNELRFQRRNGVVEQIPQAKDGGRSYSATALVDNNYVEERADKAYATGFHVKEMVRHPKYTTEQMSAFAPRDPEYSGRVRALYSVARHPPSDLENRTRASLMKGGQADVIHYGREGFGQQPRQDHTVDSKRGAHWLGIAPPVSESVATTVTRQAKLEFQERSVCSDPRAKFLTNRGCTDGRTEAANERLAHSQRFTSTWRTMYKSDFSEAPHVQRMAISR